MTQAYSNLVTEHHLRTKIKACYHLVAEMLPTDTEKQIVCLLSLVQAQQLLDAASDGPTLNACQSLIDAVEREIAVATRSRRVDAPFVVSRRLWRGVALKPRRLVPVWALPAR